MHADPQRAIFKGKTLLYLVKDVSDWLMRDGILCYLIPEFSSDSKIDLATYVRDLDGLVLQGGADVAPESYGESPMKPEWKGDAVRDAYEIKLVKEFRKQNKPVLGLCRGLQLLNVAFGGTLLQDIQTQVPEARNHRNWDIYDQNFHEVEIEAGSQLAGLYGGKKRVKVNSVHHQGIKDLGLGMIAEAHSTDDGIIEAIRFGGPEYVVGVQWHPEFQDPRDSTLLDTGPILRDFTRAAQERKSK